MEIAYLGGSSVLVSTKDLKIVVDPADQDKSKAEVTLVTSQTNGGFTHQDGFKIDGPGEFEIKGVSIRGIPAQLHVDKPKDPLKSVMYTLEYKGVRTLITGNIAPNLNDKQLDAIGAVNVLVIPVGGHGLTLDANAASGIVGQLEPSYVVPVHFDDGKTKYPMPQDKIEVFLREVGSEDTKPEPKLKISDKELPELTRVAWLSRQA